MKEILWIEQLKKYFKNNNSIVSNLTLIENTLNNKEYDIAVVANMSAGKSMFVNALLGEEVLPSFNEATSDVPVIISPNEEFKAIVEFEDNKKKVEIQEKCIEEIKLYAKKDDSELDNKYQNVSMIHIEYPFKNIKTDNVEINIIDTPGPNNTGEFKDKHKKMTRDVLRNVNAVLFLFDYTQLDANLDSDEQGLWNSIKTRVQNDKNFKVIFILNKIDAAIEDNVKLDNSEEALKHNWFKKEQEAIKKLEKAAKEHGIDNPIILPVSSKLALYMRKEKLTRVEKRFIRDIEEDIEYVFGEEYIEDKIIEYSGIEKVEEYLNKFIQKDVIELISNQVKEQIISIINNEINKLNTEIQTLSKPYQDTLKSISNTKHLIQILLPTIEEELFKSFDEKKNIVMHEINTLLYNELNKIEANKFKNQVSTFLYRRLKESYITAKNFALKTTQNGNITSNISIDLQDQNGEKFINDYHKFKKELISELIENFNDHTSIIIKNKFRDYETIIYEMLSNQITKIEKEINKSLNIKQQSISFKPLKLNVKLNLITNDAVIDKHTIKQTRTKKDYKYKFNINFLGFKKKVKLWETTKTETRNVTTRTLVIDIKELEKDIEKVRNDIESQINNYEKEIKPIFIDIRDKYISIFNQIKNDKINELVNLERNLHTAEDNIEKAKTKLIEIQNIKKEIL